MKHTTTRNACYYLLIEHFAADAFESGYCEKQGLRKSGKMVKKGWGNSLKQAKQNAVAEYRGNCELSCVHDEKLIIVNNRTILNTLNISQNGRRNP